MTIGEIFERSASLLEGVYDRREAENIARLLLSHYLQLSFTEIKHKSQEEISKPDEEVLQSHLQELKQGKPIQHIIGEVEFADCLISVDSNVLIPRPETEWIVSEIIAEHKYKQNLKILDLCTGSGCIAIALAKNLNAPSVTATDYSDKILEIASANALKNKADVRFIQHDLLGEETLSTNDDFDILVSNPPYIPIQEKETMHSNVVQHEPHEALFVPDEQALVFYEKIIRLVKTMNLHSVALYLEIHSLKADEIRDLFLSDKQFQKVEIKKDFWDRDRLLTAYFKN